VLLSLSFFFVIIDFRLHYSVDTVVDFREIKDELSGNRKRSRWSRRISRRIISNPRHSTFRQLSPTAHSFHNAPSPPQFPGAAPTLDPRQPRQPGGLTGMSEFEQLKKDVIFRRGERVAVEFDASSGRPPTLHMRFSVLEMPSPAVVAELAHLSTTAKSRPQTMTDRIRRPSSYYANSTMTRLSTSNPYLAASSKPIANPESAGIHNAFAQMSVSGHGHTRDASQLSGYADSVNSVSNSVVNRLAAQFPGLPPRVTNLSQYRQTLYERDLEREREAELVRNTSGKSGKSWKSGSGLSTSNSMKRKPAPRASAYLDEIGAVNAAASNPVSQVQPVPLDPFDDTNNSSPTSLPTPGPIPLPNESFYHENARSSPPHRRNPTAESGSTAATDYNVTRPWIDRVPGPGTDMSTPRSFGQSSAFTTPSSENPFKYDEVQQLPGPSSQRGIPFILRSTNRRSRIGSRVLSVAPSDLAAVREDQDGLSTGRSNIDIDSQQYHNRGKSMETIDISWLRRPGESDGESSGLSAYEEPTLQRATRGKMSASSSVRTPPLQASRSDTSLVRIKSIGKAPRRYTPAPVKTNYTRESIYIEPIVIPPRGQAFTEVELVQGSGISSVRSGPLRDSDVLGPDDRVYVHAQ